MSRNEARDDRNDESLAPVPLAIREGVSHVVDRSTVRHDRYQYTN